MTIQEKIMYLRRLGWTQAQIHTHTGIPQSSVSKIENGEQQDVSYSKGIALDQLITECKVKAQSQDSTATN
jgi:predicted XRE-type DNA-binding protein